MPDTEPLPETSDEDGRPEPLDEPGSDDLLSKEALELIDVQRQQDLDPVGD